MSSSSPAVVLHEVRQPPEHRPARPRRDRGPRSRSPNSEGAVRESRLAHIFFAAEKANATGRACIVTAVTDHAGEAAGTPHTWVYYRKGIEKCST